MTVYKLDHVTKIEGHARLNVKIEDGIVKKVELNVFEGSRYFESLVLNRHYEEISELTARICGICSPAHRIAALIAIEDAINVKPSEQTTILRELLVNGAHMESHGLHALLVSLVDYLGFKDPFEMMRKKPELVKDALEIKRVGNLMVKIVGGRAIQPITPKVNGFKKLPSKDELNNLLKELKNVRPLVLKFLQIFSQLQYPNFWRECNHYCTTSPTYSMIRGRPDSFRGHSFPVQEFQKHVKEIVIPYSTAKFSRIQGETYMVGALPRLNVNSHKLTPEAKEWLFKTPSFNTFHNDFAQVIELIHLVDNSINVLEGFEVKKENTNFTFKPGVGFSSTEAPRGTLYHNYEFNKEGRVVKADILTPTAQNLPNLENDIKEYLSQLISKGEKEILWGCERMIRAYDPCISCSTHFLKLKINNKTVS
ncbi:MAG: Ni/Fe hydrogenase subunit alpha [Nanoarchaeota archaeon]|nr:Ni/Fe hydrogenase subunit alpha [Nanoarchaeota archaeon]